MIDAVSNHLWQSTVFALVAGLLTLAFRSNRAQVRFWLWLAASLKFLLPLAILLSLGAHLPTAAQRQPLSEASIPVSMLEVSQPFPVQPASAVHGRPQRDWISPLLATVWAIGFLAIVTLRVRGWRRVREAVRASQHAGIAAPIEVRHAPGLLEPGVVGIFRPVLLLPEGIAQRLTPEQLAAVLAHELCHVRRRDNLFALMHMIVEAAFWFHPLVWWIGARLIEERERACDEEVLRQGNQPLHYAEAILSVCELYAESPLRCVSGVTGADLKKRIQAILTQSSARELNYAKRALLTAAGFATVAIPLTIGILNAPRIRAQSIDSRPQFEVAAISPCGPTSPSGAGKAGGGGGGGRGSVDAGSSRGRITLPCLPVRGFIQLAYVDFADGKRIDRQSDVRLESGTGPDWIYSDRYRIQAKAEDSASEEMMMGPMLQRLLEDRFKLKIRRDSRDTPLYALTLAKGGIKMQPYTPGSCTVRDLTKYPMPPVQPGDPPPCDGAARIGANKIALDIRGGTMTMLARRLLRAGRPVIDKTGLDGRFDIHLEYTPEEPTQYPPGVTPPVDDSPAAQTIFTALGALGLKLEPVKGPREFWVIDHIERPTAN